MAFCFLFFTSCYAGISGHPGGRPPGHLRATRGHGRGFVEKPCPRAWGNCVSGHPRDPIHGICRWSRSIMVSGNSSQRQALMTTLDRLLMVRHSGELFSIEYLQNLQNAGNKAKMSFKPRMELFETLCFYKISRWRQG